jgi:hypothetical protein
MAPYDLYHLGALALLIGGLGLGCRSDANKENQSGSSAPVSTEGAPSPTPASAGDTKPSSDPACAKAEACCTAMVKKLPTAQQNLDSCSAVRRMPADNCIPMYEKYRQAAQAMGVTCD